MMSDGIRADIRVGSPGDCPLAQVSAVTGNASYSVTKSVDPTSPTDVTEEFMLDAETNWKEVDANGAELVEVFSYGSKSIYRMHRTGGWGCPCERIEQFAVPVIDIHTSDGDLFLSFHVRTVEQLREIIGDLRKRYPSLDVQRLVRSQPQRTEQTLVFVDRSELTDRQLEVIETAHEMGYFDHPKAANAGEIAAALDITTSTFTEHLSTAQRKLLDSILAS